MKIAGITWWRNNYGSILQAYALQQYLRETEQVEYTIINQYSKKMASFDNLIDKLKTVGFVGTIKRLVFRFGLKKLRERVASLQRFVDENLIVTEEIYNEDNISITNSLFDGFICGSDQIWNPANTSLESMYWLCFADHTKLKIAYAPSIGISRATEEQAAKIKQNLESFDAISSREEEGTNLINAIMGEDKCKTVLDPTMLVERSIWDDISQERIEDGKYIFVYILKGNKNERKMIEKFSKIVSLPIVTMPFLDGETIVPYDIKFGETKLWSVSPADFISAIRGAEYIFTDSFHCMVFSCLYHKTFYTFPKKGALQMSRLIGLQKLLDTGDRMIHEEDLVEDLLNKTNIDWERIDENLLLQRNRSRQYIHDALIS